MGRWMLDGQTDVGWDDGWILVKCGSEVAGEPLELRLYTLEEGYLHGDQSRLTAEVQMRQGMSQLFWTEINEHWIRQQMSSKVPKQSNDMEDQVVPAPTPSPCIVTQNAMIFLFLDI